MTANHAGCVRSPRSINLSALVTVVAPPNRLQLRASRIVRYDDMWVDRVSGNRPVSDTGYRGFYFEQYTTNVQSTRRDGSAEKECDGRTDGLPFIQCQSASNGLDLSSVGGCQLTDRSSGRLFRSSTSC